MGSGNLIIVMPTKECRLGGGRRLQNYASEAKPGLNGAKTKRADAAPDLQILSVPTMMLSRERAIFTSHCLWPIAKNLGNLPWLV